MQFLCACKGVITMGLILESEKFEIFDVSNVKVEEKLALERKAENLVPRNEDESFIREFIAERGFGRIGSDKISQWARRVDWNAIAWAVSDMQHSSWIKTEYIESPDKMPDVVEPDPERDQVTDNESLFMGFYPIRRYSEKVCYEYEPGKQNPVWKFPDAYLKNGLPACGAKKLDEFIQIYTDFSKMNAIWVGPRGDMAISATATATFDDVMDEDKNTQSVKEISVTARIDSAKANMVDGSFVVSQELTATYNDANGNEMRYSFDPITIWRKRINYEKEIKDGKDSDGKQKYKKVTLKEESKVDLTLDYGDMKYEEGGYEKEWALKASIWMVQIDVSYHNFETGKGSQKKAQFIVKTKVDGKKVITGEDIRVALSERIPAANDGLMTGMSMELYTFGSAGDIAWNNRIKEESNV